MARGALLLSHEFDGGGRIVGDEALLEAPPKVALQTDEGTVDRGRFLPPDGLQVAPVPGECGSGDPLRGKAGIAVDSGLTLPLIPGDEVAQITQVIANRCYCQILSLAQPVLIGNQC